MLSRARFVMGLVMVCAIATLAVMAGSQAQQSVGFESGASSPGLITSVPRTMSYQGVLKDSNGDPVRNTTLDVTFRIFDAYTGGNQLWTDIVQIETDQRANFTAILSNLNLPFDEDYYLELQIEGDPQPLEPRQKLHMVPYSARTDTSDYAFSSLSGGGWVDDGTVVRLETSTDDVGVGTATPSEKLDVNGNVHITGDLTVDGIINPFPFRIFDSGWFSVAPNSSYTYPHNLGTVKMLITLFGATDMNGADMSTLATPEGNDGQNKMATVGQITTTHFTLRVGIHQLGHIWDSSNWVTATHARIIALALE